MKQSRSERGRKSGGLPGGGRRLGKRLFHPRGRRVVERIEFQGGLDARGWRG